MKAVWHNLAPAIPLLAALHMASCGDDGQVEGPDGAASSEDAGDETAAPASDAASCTAAPRSSPDFATTSKEWAATWCLDEHPHLGVVEARCPDGTQLLAYLTGTSGETRVFDASGAFLGSQTHHEGGGPCQAAYWPRRIDCGEATVKRVVCGGQALAVGSRFPY